MHELLRHEFAFEFDIPATYPATAPEIRIPELDGKTAKMYRGGAICLTVHFKPLWAKNRRAVCLQRNGIQLRHKCALAVLCIPREGA